MKHKIALLFAGQGAQFVGMGADFFAGEEGAIYDLMRDGPTEQLNLTANAQPAIYLHDLAAAEELRKRGIAPDCVAGFSLGEIPALVFAGMLNKEDGLKLVKVRAEAMQKCCEENPGAMVAVVRLPKEKVLEIVRGSKDVWAVNFNSPEQTVCSCSAEQADAFCDAVAAAGGRTVRLKVSGAFHCKHMSAASRVVEKWLSGKKIETAKLPAYSNFSGKLYSGDSKGLIAHQINNPVLWQTIIENMLQEGVRTFIEVGPGQVLSGLVKKITDAKGAEDVKIFNVGDMASVEAAVKGVLG